MKRFNVKWVQSGYKTTETGNSEKDVMDMIHSLHYADFYNPYSVDDGKWIIQNSFISNQFELTEI